MTPTLLTYYEDLGEVSVARTLDLWKEVWLQQGWKPVVLSTLDAKQHPKYAALTEHCVMLPTVNERRFEMACYQRWLAFAMFGGIMMDFDVFPQHPFLPKGFLGFTTGSITGDVSLIAGDRTDFETIVDLIVGYEPKPVDLTYGRPHVSDMVILQHNQNIFATKCDLCRRYNSPGWQQPPLVHFTNHKLELEPGMERTDLIRKVLSL